MGASGRAAGYLAASLLLQTSFAVPSSTTSSSRRRLRQAASGSGSGSSSSSGSGSGAGSTVCTTTATPCSGNGACAEDDSAPGGYACTCSGGWSGTQCSVQGAGPGPSVGACNSMVQPCSGNGVCVNSAVAGLGYLCNCNPGFGSPPDLNCASPTPTACATTPCGGASQGTCAPSTTAPAGYTCTCIPPYSGPQCGQQVSPCAASLCQNGGLCNTCTPGGTEACCACVGPWTGPQCAQAKPPPPPPPPNGCATTSLPCGGEGTCTSVAVSVNAQGFTCVCTPPFTGPRCGQTINPCTVSPCSNGGTCTQAAPGIPGAAYKCACAAPWIGKTCATLDACATQPCGTNGACAKAAGNTFKCKCFAGWNGTKCSLATCTNSKYAAADPCGGNGKCKDMTAAQMAAATPPGGLHQPAGTTWPSPIACKGGCSARMAAAPTCAYGVCHPKGKTGFRCVCEYGWTGKRCGLAMCGNTALSCGNTVAGDPCQRLGMAGKCRDLDKAAMIAGTWIAGKAAPKGWDAANSASGKAGLTWPCAYTCGKAKAKASKLLKTLELLGVGALIALGVFALISLWRCLTKKRVRAGVFQDASRILTMDKY